MKLISKEALEALKKAYPIGCTVVLVEMEDDQAPPVGTTGIVSCIDDIGSIRVKWANGSSLGVLYEVDKCERVHTT